jgi:hypothetical protein
MASIERTVYPRFTRAPSVKELGVELRKVS